MKRSKENDDSEDECKVANEFDSVVPPLAIKAHRTKLDGEEKKYIFSEESKIFQQDGRNVSSNNERSNTQYSQAARGIPVASPNPFKTGSLKTKPEAESVKRSDPPRNDLWQQNRLKLPPNNERSNAQDPHEARDIKDKMFSNINNPIVRPDPFNPGLLKKGNSTEQDVGGPTRNQEAFRSSKHEKDNTDYLLEELEKILHRAGKCFEYSPTAINSFLASYYFNNKNHTEHQIYDIHLNKQKIPEYCKEYWDTRAIYLKNIEESLIPKKHRGKKYELYCRELKISNIKPLKYGFLERQVKELFDTGGANCHLQAAVLRAFLIHELKEEDLSSINYRNIKVSQYANIEHAFIVIKNFYSTADEPKNHLVMDTWVQHLYLPREPGNSSVLPISKDKYPELLEGIKDKGISKIMKEFIKKNTSAKDDQDNKAFIGPLNKYHEFLISIADGAYIALKHKHAFAHLDTIDRNYFNTAVLEDITDYQTDDEYRTLYALLKDRPWVLGK